MKIRIPVDEMIYDRVLSAIKNKYTLTSDEQSLLNQMYRQIKEIVSPFALYKINSNITGNQLVDNNTSAVVIINLGEDLDALYNEYVIANETEKIYLLDCIANELLPELCVMFNLLYGKFHRRYIKKYIFVDYRNELQETYIIHLLKMLDSKEEVKRKIENDNSTDCDTSELLDDQSNDYREKYEKLIGSKSVMFYAVLTENPNETHKNATINM